MTYCEQRPRQEDICRRFPFPLCVVFCAENNIWYYISGFCLIAKLGPMLDLYMFFSCGGAFFVVGDSMNI